MKDYARQVANIHLKFETTLHINKNIPKWIWYKWQKMMEKELQMVHKHIALHITETINI